MNSEGDDVSAATEPELAPVEQPVTRSTLLGAEMLNWSDLEPADARPALGGPAAQDLLAAVLAGGEKVLLGGPHSLDVIRAAADRAGALDVLLRSYDDAETVAEAFDAARVFAGGLDRFGADHGEPAYDVIVALDGVPRLAGTDTPALGWTEAIDLLRRRLAPGGRLLVGAANPFGLDRLLDVPELPGADDWGRDVGQGGEPPAGLAAVRKALDATGLAVEATYCLYGGRTLGLIEPDAALVALHTARQYEQALADPYRTAFDAVAAGHGVALAPAYWFVLRNGGPEGQLPGRLGAEGAEAADETADGVLVEELLLAATRADDQTALHRIVREYAGWLSGADPAVAAQAAPDNTLAGNSAYKIFIEGPAEPGRGEALVVRHLARFVTRTLAAGGRWPWPAGGTPRSQTTLLASMAGITVDDDLWAAAGVPDEPIRPRGHAEQLATIERLTAELADARTQVDWFEGQLDKLRKSRSYQVGRAIVSPLRTTYGRLRSRLR